jgi:5-methylcytosine-specific restriction endonuclease McrA
MAGLYTYRWQKAAAAFLVRHPLCQCPHCEEGRLRVRVSQVVDHKKPHRGDVRKFWDRGNWQALNKACHDSYKQRLEKTGRIEGARIDGTPIDPSHPWNNEAHEGDRGSHPSVQLP